ncbi:hypothetical protein C8J56DRAFT_1042071 [Mycena floridula]|nr:hypothetical protein C8J56DRAFT_1042071 [Mycena floridula]
MVKNPPLNEEEIYKAARAAVSALKANNLTCCVFGSAACSLYGTTRVPHDVDIVVLTALNPERIKELIVASDPNFRLVPARDRRNNWKVMWYRLKSRGGRECKVDILIPNVPSALNIPLPPPTKILFFDEIPGIPVLPLLPLLILKLQGWSDHRAATEQRYKKKQFTDVEDLDELLDFAVADPDYRLWREDWMPDWFVAKAKERVRAFVEVHPETKEAWLEIGFMLPEWVV